MPPLAPAHEKHAITGLPKFKKTKSRNGCARCKQKRLKCDETTPGCFQCSKRNAPCPGYEKTLKWSTKYEVFQPPQVTSSTVPTVDSKVATNKVAPIKGPEVNVTADVKRGFEALAAVLPTGNKKFPASELSRKDTPHQSPSPAAPVDTVTAEQVSSPESCYGSSPEYDLPEPLFEDTNDLDPMLFDQLIDAMGVPAGDMAFDEMEGFDIDPGPLDRINFDAEETQRPADDAAGTALTSSRLSRSLLLDFYRLPSPSPTMKSANDNESFLTENYFKHVCALFSSFDSGLNPFRIAVERVYQDTPCIRYAIQSMSAAQLANAFPYMATVGLEMQRKAFDAIHEELPLVESNQVSCNKAFLSITLLGLSASWHEAGNLGQEYLSIARNLILPRLLSNTDGEEKQRQTQFFEESLIYWEMLMGFVSQDAMTFGPSGPRARGTQKWESVARKPDGKIVPHPLTGIAPAIHLLFAEVGRLVRRERILEMASVMDIRRRQENHHNAVSLEEDLFAVEYPSADELADLEDELTSKHDFVVMAQAYRCAGLLEIYRVFPSVLRKRLETGKPTWMENVDLFPTPRFDTPYEGTDTKLWLNSLAMHILDTISSIPASSRTIRTQPILLVTAASELRLISSVDFFDVNVNDARVLQARNFAIGRLREHALPHPAKPLRRMIDLINEVWLRQDNGDNTFWIDVMIEKGWHTIMG